MHPVIRETSFKTAMLSLGSKWNLMLGTLCFRREALEIDFIHDCVHVAVSNKRFGCA